MNLHSSARAATCAAVLAVTLHASPVFANQETVTITTDVYGVRHIDAASDEGAFYGAGYAAARDRLFHMMWTRVILEGRVASYFGAGTGNENIVSDRKARTYGWARHAAAESAYLSANEPALFELLDAFADGVNAVRVDVLNGPAAGRALFDANGMAAELSVAWTPADSIGVWTRFVRNFQPLPLGEARMLYQVLALLDQGKTEEEVVEILFPGFKCDESAAIVLESDVDPALIQAMQAYKTQHGLRDNIFCAEESGLVQFSNAWAVSGSSTTTGESVLVGQPRVGISVPGRFYEYHMQSPTLDVRGASIAGCPTMLVGSTPHMAWSVTKLSADQMDLFEIQRRGNNTYLLDDTYVQFAPNETEVIEVLGGSPETVKYRETVFGPLVTEFVDLTGVPSTPGLEYAVRAVPLQFADHSTFKGFVRMAQATDIANAGGTGFFDALEDWAYPSANMVFASADGSIGYAAVGAMPVRNPTFLAGTMAQNGRQSANDWIELLPHEFRPWVIDPARGHVHSANHMAVGGWYPLPRIFGGIGDNPRSRRCRERLDELGANATPADVGDIRHDARGVVGRDITRLAVYARDVQGHVFVGPQSNYVLDLLEIWLDDTDGDLIDHEYSLLAGQVDGGIRYAPDPPGVIEEYGRGEAGMHAFLKQKIALLDGPFEGVVLDADELQLLDNVLQRTYQGFKPVSLRDTPSQWQQEYQSVNLTATVIPWDILDKVSTPVDPNAPGQIIESGLRTNDGRTLAQPIGQIYEFYDEVGGAADDDASLPGFGQREGALGPHYTDLIPIWKLENLKPAPRTAAGIAAIFESSETLIYVP